MELAPEGTGYRARTRFAKFFNLPELMNLFREVADIKTADQLKGWWTQVIARAKKAADRDKTPTP